VALKAQLAPHAPSVWTAVPVFIDQSSEAGGLAVSGMTPLQYVVIVLLASGLWLSVRYAALYS
jgi:hypothetical protein